MSPGGQCFGAPCLESELAFAGKLANEAFIRDKRGLIAVDRGGFVPYTFGLGIDLFGIINILAVHVNFNRSPTGAKPEIPFS